MQRKRYEFYFWAAATAIILGAVLYCSWPLGFWLNPAASVHGLASEFGAFGQPYNWVFIGGDVTSGALLVVGCALIGKVARARGWARWCLLLLALYGVCGALDAALPMHCLPSMQTCGPIFRDPLLVLHGVFDYVGALALLGTLVAAWRYTLHHARAWVPWIYVMAALGTIFALLSVVFMAVNGPGYWAQRYYISISSIWVASIPFVLRPSHVRPRKRVRR